MNFVSLSEVSIYLADLGSTLAGLDPPRARAVSRALVHVSRGIEYSMIGYPEPRSWLFQNTVGRIAKAKFLRAQAMSHDTDAPIPGEPVADTERSALANLALLQARIDEFTCFRGALSPHFAFGVLPRYEYDQIHAMHIADHFSKLEVLPPIGLRREIP